MSSQSSQNAMSQSNLSFGASKASAAANKAKQAGGTAAPSPPAPTPTEPGLPTAAEAQTEKKSDAKDDATLSASTSSTPQEGKETAGNKEQNKREETIEKGAAKEDVIGTVSQPKDQDVTPVVAKDVKEESGAKEELGAAEENKVVEGKAKDTVQTTEDPIDPIEAMLRVFDLTPKYGPYIGMTRGKRWKRAQELELDPPLEVYDALTTEEGLEDPKYAQCVFEGRV